MTARAFADEPAAPAAWRTAEAEPGEREPQPAATVGRTALVNRLRVHRQGAIVALAAPPGYGKTTLLADWRRHEARPFASVTLDRSDNEPLALLTRIALELRSVGVLAAPDVEAVSAPGTAGATAAAHLGLVLGRLDVPFVIALDDVHLLESDESIQALNLLVDHLPAAGKLAVAGDADPPLPLARLRVSGRLVELGVDELRLNDREAGALLQGAGVELAPAGIAELNRRTAGWAAGLLLAARSLGRPGLPGSPAAAFAGVEPAAAGWFGRHVLPRLEPEELAFLTRTSVLDRLSGPLCDAVLGRSGSDERLESLRRSQLFLVRLDREQRWYRIHSLFRRVLRSELERREPGLAPELNARAADWCETNGATDEAIGYADESGDRERVVALVGLAARRLYGAGRSPAVERWLERLEDGELLSHHPEIAILAAWLHILSGRPEAASRCAASADAGAPDREMPDGTASAEPWLALLRVMLCRRGVRQMRRDAELAVQTIADGSTVKGQALVGLAYAHLLAGEPDRAERLLVEAPDASLPHISLIALAERSLLAAARGDRVAADELARRAEEIIRHERLEDFVTSSLGHVAVARAALRRSEWVEARAALAAAARLVPQLTYAWPWFAVHVRVELARAFLALAEPRRAAPLLAESDEVLTRRPGLGILVEEVAELRRELRAAAANAGGSGLTAAELRLVPLLARHLSFREIAESLHLSRNTVKTQAISVYRKLGVCSRGDAVACARGLGLLDPPPGLEGDRRQDPGSAGLRARAARGASARGGRRAARAR